MLDKQEIKELVIYESKDRKLKIDTRFDGETFWLNRQQLAKLFNRGIKTIGRHVNNALKEELQDIPVVAKYATTALITIVLINVKFYIKAPSWIESIPSILWQPQSAALAMSFILTVEFIKILHTLFKNSKFPVN